MGFDYCHSTVFDGESLKTLMVRHVGKQCATLLTAECLLNINQAADVVIDCVFFKTWIMIVVSTYGTVGVVE